MVKIRREVPDKRQSAGVSVEHRGIVLAGALVALLATTTLAQNLPEYVLTNFINEPDETGLTNLQNTARDIAVTPDGSRMVFSSSGNNASGCVPPFSQSQGVIFIYDYDEATGTWLLNETIKDCSISRFGQQLAISDDGATILAGFDPIGLFNNGRAWVYREIDGDWVLDEVFEDLNDGLGLGVDLDSTGNLAVLVAPEQIGSYFTIYRRSAGGVWGQELFEGPSPFGDGFGPICAIDGDWAAVVDTVNGERRVGMYEFIGPSWVLQQALVIPEANWNRDGDITIDGDRMIVGQGQCCGEPGFVRIYERNPGTNEWELVLEDIGGSVNGVGNELGRDVDLQGDLAVATRWRLNDAVYYHRDENDGWERVGTLGNPTTSWTRTDSAAISDRGFLLGGTISIGQSRALVAEYAPPVEVCSFTENFDGLSEIPPSLFAIERGCPQQSIENGAIVLERPQPCVEGNSFQLALGDFIVGDFDIAIDFDILESPPFVGGGSALFPAALTVYSQTGFDGPLEMRIERVIIDFTTACVPTLNFHKSWDRVAGSANCDSAILPTTSLSSSYRITREGTLWASYIKEAGDADWTLLRTATLSDGPVLFAVEQFGNSGLLVKTAFDNLAVTTGADCDLCLPDINDDGNLNFFDVSAYLNLYNVGEPAADLTGDGNLNFFDVSAYLDLYNAGCP